MHGEVGVIDQILITDYLCHKLHDLLIVMHSGFSIDAHIMFSKQMSVIQVPVYVELFLSDVCGVSAGRGLQKPRLVRVRLKG